MGRRSENLFRRNDVMRAVKAARDAGVRVAGVEITCKARREAVGRSQ